MEKCSGKEIKKVAEQLTQKPILKSEAKVKILSSSELFEVYHWSRLDENWEFHMWNFSFWVCRWKSNAKISFRAIFICAKKGWFLRTKSLVCCCWFWITGLFQNKSCENHSFDGVYVSREMKVKPMWQWSNGMDNDD